MHQPRNEQPPAIFSLSPTAIDFDNAAVMTRLPPELVQVSPGCRIFCSPPGFCLMNKLQDYAPTKKPRARIEKSAIRRYVRPPVPPGAWKIAVYFRLRLRIKTYARNSPDEALLFREIYRLNYLEGLM